MTNKLVVIIKSLKVPKIKRILLYEMKFLVPNYSCLQNHWLGGYRPQIPVLSVLCPQLNLLNPPPEQNSWLRHWPLSFETFIKKQAKPFLCFYRGTTTEAVKKENVWSLIGAHILFIDNSAWVECKRIHVVYQAITHFPLGWPEFVFLEGSTVSLVSRVKWGSGAQHRPAQLAALSL